ncbi:MAG: LysM peptidoglycan-binding domain-containing protein [Pseudomonadota bacterium]
MIELSGKARALRAGLLCAGAAIAVMAATGGGNEARAQSIECGGDYRVVPGDTLSEIAVRTYGAGRFGPIFDANRNTIRSPQTLEVGDTIFIPCLDGTGNPLPRGVRPERTVAAEPEPEPEVEEAALSPSFQAAPGPADAAALQGLANGGVVNLLAVRPSPPFAGEKLPEGGMLTEIIQRALLRAPVPIDFVVSFTGGDTIDDIAVGDYDLGYPLSRPACEQPQALDDEARRVCADYVFSDPIYATGIGMFVTNAGDFAEARSASDLYGSRLCRPEGMGNGDLAAAGLIAPNVNPVSARDVDECFMMLALGDVNVVSVPQAEGDAAAKRLDVSARVRSIKSIGEGQPLYAASPRSSALGAAYIAVINQGLAEMRGNGSYAAIVDNHLAFTGIN